LPHHFARLELYCGSGRDFKAASRLVRIAANAFFGESNFEYPEIPQLDIFAARQRIGNQIERSLDYVKHLMLNQAGVITDLYNDVPFCQVSHCESFHRSEFLWHFRWPSAVSAVAANRLTLSLFRTIDQNANEARI
jgi:hypothetical protein